MNFNYFSSIDQPLRVGEGDMAVVFCEFLVETIDTIAFNVFPTTDGEQSVLFITFVVVITSDAFVVVNVLVGFTEVKNILSIDVIMIPAFDVNTALELVVVILGAPAEVADGSLADSCDGTTDVIPIVFVVMVDVAVVFPLFDDVRTIGITIAAPIPRMITTVVVNNIFFFFGFA
jgi:hypothetical protein